MEVQTIDFSKYSDKKLKAWITMWQDVPATRILNPFKLYARALFESFRRFEEDENYRLVYFMAHPNASTEDYNRWMREL